MSEVGEALAGALKDAVRFQIMNDVIVQITGGRDYDDEDMVFETLTAFHVTSNVALVRHGGARGADFLAGKWARLHCVPEEKHMADWSRFGKRAGILRNEAMLKAQPPASFLLTFPGGRGTAHMVDICRKAGLPIVTIHSAMP